MSAEALYAMYRGEQLIGVGTKKELARRRGVKASTVHFWSTPAYKKHLKPGHNAIHVYRIDDEEDG